MRLLLELIYLCCVLRNVRRVSLHNWIGFLWYVSLKFHVYKSKDTAPELSTPARSIVIDICPRRQGPHDFLGCEARLVAHDLFHCDSLMYPVIFINTCPVFLQKSAVEPFPCSWVFIRSINWFSFLFTYVSICLYVHVCACERHQTTKGCESCPSSMWVPGINSSHQAHQEYL